MQSLKTPDQFRSKPAKLVVAVVGLVLAFALANRAIDSASVWQYAAVILVSVLSIRLIIRTLKK